MATTPAFSTIAFPTDELRESVGALPEGMQSITWDPRIDRDTAVAEIVDAVVLPYQGAASVLPALASLPRLMFVQTQTTGYDGVREAVGPRVAVASASGTHAAATAELAIGLILASLRGIKDAVLDQHNRAWRPERRPSLADRHVLLVGVGGIGRKIAARLEPFEVTMTRLGSVARDDEHGHVHGVEELVVLAASAEIIVVVTPLTDRTHHLIDARVLAALPDGALVVNVARGAVVDSEALTREVLSGRLHCAIDVFDPEPLPVDHPLWAAPNALITPHVGGNSSAFEIRIVELLRSQMRALASGKRPENLVQSGPYG